MNKPVSEHSYKTRHIPTAQPPAPREKPPLKHHRKVIMMVQGSKSTGK